MLPQDDTPLCSPLGDYTPHVLLHFFSQFFFLKNIFLSSKTCTWVTFLVDYRAREKIFFDFFFGSALLGTIFGPILEPFWADFGPKFGSKLILFGHFG